MDEAPDDANAMNDSTSAAEASPTYGAMLVGILKSLRPHQWVKNVFVLAPLFFSQAFLEPRLLSLGLAAAFLFCLTSGAVYLLNDVFDVEKDRNHPVKRNRPVASGQLPVRVAKYAAVVLGFGSVLVGFTIDVRFGAVLGSYMAMNFAYSASLKHLAFIDVGIIAVGFVLRVIAGALAIDVYISEWLFGCTFLLALYLGFGKRQHELRLVSEGRAKEVRRVLERYHPEHLDFAVLFVAGLTIACYTVYTLTASLPDQPLRTERTPFASPYLPGTIPFVVFGITRFYQLINKDSPHSPTDLLLRDVPFLVNGFLWGAMIVTLFFIH